MIAVTPVLHLVVALAMVAPAVDPSTCAADDLHCSATAYAAAARRVKSDVQRVEYLYFANRAYLALSKKSPESLATRNLCKAKQLIDQAHALPATELRGRVVESRRVTLARLAENQGRCTKPKEGKKNGAPLVALADGEADPPPKLLAPEPPSPPSDPASTPATSPPVASLVAPASTATTADDLLPVVRTSAPPRHLDGPPKERKRQAPAGRRLVIAGGVSLGVGLALTGVAGFMGGRMLNSWRESRQLHDEAGLFGTDAESERDVALAKEYDRLRAPTVTLAVLGASTVIVGAVLVGVGAKRLARLASRTAILPMPGGVAFRARF